MIKVWCEECKGKGIIERNGHYLQECTNCNGKGYTEHESELSDLELSAAVREHIGKNIFISIYRMHEVFHDIDHFIEWHREQKRGAE